MDRICWKHATAGIGLAIFCFIAISCRAAASNEEFFGTTAPPERWDVNNDSSEFVFHLRKNARWSNGDPITAEDFIFSVRRALSPELAARSAYLAYYIKYSQAYNEGAVFVKDAQTNQFLLEKDVAAVAQEGPLVLSEKPLGSGDSEYQPTAAEPKPDPDTPFHQFMHSPARLTLPGSEKARAKLLAADPRLQAAVEGKQFVPVKAEDIGVEAVDNYTVRISLSQPAPYFIGLLGYQLFRLTPRKIIEKYGSQWTNPAHIVTSGAFKVKSWLPYSELVVERNPMYWDASHVRLEEIHFYTSIDNPTSMNLYKVGEADAVLNHTVPNAWLDVVRPKKDYMDKAEAAIAYILMNVTKPPMNDLRVRRAFNMAIDKVNYAKSRIVTKPLVAFTPEGIFPGYPQPKGDGFDPEQARKLLAEAGYPVTNKAGGGYECKGFPVEQVEFVFNTLSSNKTMAEFMQAQWKQTLGITVPLRSMEFKTFMNVRSKLEYKGFAIGGWGADYMDPFTFLGLFSTAGGDNGSGWFDQKYVDLLDQANRTVDKQKRYELLARAEKYMLDAQPVIPIETPSVNWMKKPYVKGLYPNAASLFPWKFVYIERDPAKWDYGVPKLTE